jgi:hypothetical protein
MEEETREGGRVSGMIFLIGASLLQSSASPTPLPADPPIGGAIWTVVIPAILLIGSFLATYLLYRRFSKGGGE